MELEHMNPMVSTFRSDTSRTAFPWLESPYTMDFIELMLEQGRGTAWEPLQFSVDGFIKIDLELSDEFIDTLIDEAYSNETVVEQEEGYHYNDSPRIFEAWKTSQKVLDLARHPKVLEKLEFLYGRKPLPFQTINFRHSSNQPLHSDTIHFNSLPNKWMCGVWVALEDTNLRTGTLQYVPKSHRWPEITFQDLGLETPEYGSQFANYKIYEEAIEAMVQKQSVKKSTLHAKKGTAIIWASNLLHGGTKATDEKLTRYSQATHYYFEGVDTYSPMFSDMNKGSISHKAAKDIMGYEIGT
jgi:hypothetical protein